MNNPIKQSRNGKIELLRVFAMVMVLVLHYLYDTLGGVLGKLSSADGINYYLAWFLESCSYVAVDVFVIISGYFRNLYKYTSLTNVLSAIALFMAFLNWGKYCHESRFDGLWRFLGKGTLGVFLIHTHFVLSPVLWNKWVRATEHCCNGTLEFLGHLVLSVICIFVFCDAIDLFRGYCFDKVTDLLNKIHVFHRS